MINFAFFMIIFLFSRYTLYAKDKCDSIGMDAVHFESFFIESIKISDHDEDDIITFILVKYFFRKMINYIII